MAEETRQAHWNKTYAEKGEEQVSWFEDRPDTSLALIRQLRTPASTAIIDIGGGASRLVDADLDVMVFIIASLLSLMRRQTSGWQHRVLHSSRLVGFSGGTGCDTHSDCAKLGGDAESAQS